MRLTMVLTAVCLILGGCGKGGGENGTNVASAPAAAIPANANNPSNQPPDYSKVSCGSVQECANACDLTHPFVDENLIRQTLCGNDPSSAICDALVKFDYDNFESSNILCRHLMTTEVIDLKSLGIQKCADGQICQQICSILYVPQSDDAIERAAAANGTLQSGQTLKDLVTNDVVKAQLAACLAAPADFVIAFISLPPIKL